MFCASISDKLDKLEKKLIENNNLKLNKVMYPSKTNTTDSFYPSPNSTKNSPFLVESEKE